MYKAEASAIVPADIGTVWTYISNYQNFDQFMSHVEKVTMLGDRTSEWRLRGPLGIPVTWRAVTTVMNPARELAWQSVEGSIKTQGHIRVEPEGDQTRIEVCVEYAPPGGAVGEAFASLFKNPQKMLEHDLENLREIIASWPAHEPARPGPAVDSVARKAEPTRSPETDEPAPSTASSTPNPLESELVKKKSQLKATLIHNPNAGGAGAISSAELEALLIGAGYAARHVPTESLEDLDRALLDPGDLVVVAGGDGTVRATVARLAGRGVPLAIVPMGTANNIGGALGLVGDPAELLGGLAEPERKTYDLGWVRGPWGEDFFLEGAGWGLFAATMAVYDPEAGKSPFRALTSFVQAVSSFQPCPLRISLDGEELDEPVVLLLEVMNTPALGPRLRLAPEASPCDGWLDVVLIREDGRVGLTRYLTGLLQNRLEELPNVTVHRCKRLQLEWDGSPFHLDAEIRTAEHPARIELEVRPAALELWLPAGIQLPEETPPPAVQDGKTQPGATPQTP